MEVLFGVEDEIVKSETAGSLQREGGKKRKV